MPQITVVKSYPGPAHHWKQLGAHIFSVHAVQVSAVRRMTVDDLSLIKRDVIAGAMEILDDFNRPGSDDTLTITDVNLG